MHKRELNYYESLGNWDFSEIKYKTEKLTNWDFYKKIRLYSNEKSICLDLGCGGGEKILRMYPKVGMIIGTDFSPEMIKTARENAKNYKGRNVKFLEMNSLQMQFPKEIFDVISVRHSVMDAKQIYQCLKENGTVIIEGVDKKDCWELKKNFGRGQGYLDEISIAEKDYADLKEAGFTKIKKVEIIENEYYETEDDLMALLLKTPILDDFSEINNKGLLYSKKIEKELFEEYVKKFKAEKGILLKRVLYGIVARK